MKKQIRFLGIDDSPFSFTDIQTLVVGVVMRGGGYIEGVLKRMVEIDGNNATAICEQMIETTRHKKQLKAVMLDGIALGGFNIVDIDQMYEHTGLPIITVTRDRPNFLKIKNALRKNFKNWESRFRLITQGDLHEIKTKHNPIFIKCAGIDIVDAKEIIKLSTIRGVIPEPIRVAHIIASGIARGESYGKA